MEKIRILSVLPKMDIGGIEAIVYNYFIRSDKSVFEWDFVVHDTEIGYLEEEAKKRGANVYHVTPKKVSLFKYFMDLNKIIKQGNYSIVHAHQNEKSYFSLLIAKFNKVPVRIAHAHTCMGNPNKIYLNLKLQQLFIRMVCTDYAFCGIAAKNWCLGKNIDGTWIRNGIDVDKFKYNNLSRTKIRKKYNINDDEKVLGMVCRLSPEKNISLALTIFSKLHEKNPKYKMIIAGDGAEKISLQQLTQKLNVEQNVNFVGRVNNSYEFYSAFDIFLLTSHYEGFPVSAIEAQCSGIPVVMSNSISSECIIQDNVVQYDILASPENWADIIDNIDLDRVEYDKKLDLFDIKNLGNQMDEYYYSLLKKRKGRKL